MDESKETEQLKRYKTCLRDIRYVLKMYRRTLPAEAWETITKLANDKKLNLKNINLNKEEV
jgi:hypothetical protein